MTISAKERAHLKSMAHKLKPIHQIGREGVNENGLAAIVDAFAHRELIKVKIQQSAPVTAREAGELIVAGVPGVEHVQTIGRTVVLYRKKIEG